ncbi:hypothetical protein DW714_04110 [Streptococcus anginosus]|nr:hypothetical protein DW714_04110 [Streptococcus anginosus]
MKILLFGNTGYVTKKFIQEAFPKNTFYLLGETDLKSSKKLKLIQEAFPKNTFYLLGETDLKSSKKLKLTVFPKTKGTILVEVLRTYQFDQIRLFVNCSGLMKS